MEQYKSTKYLVTLLCSLILLFIFQPSLVQAQDFASKLADQFLKKVAITEVDPNMTMGQALKIQEQFVAHLVKEFGEPVGYKAGLTNPAGQKAFGIPHPVRGTLLKKMIVQSGATLPADFGIRPLSEGDLILRVGSEAINQAKTKEEALKGIDAVIPFIELPDLAYDPKVKMTGPALVAINVAARYGVVGKPISLAASTDWMDRLKNFTVQLFDEKGAVFSEGKGSALLEDPLNVVLWIKDSLAAEGKKLRKGDLLSLGSITRAMPIKPGTKTVRAKFIDLDPKGPVELSVSFK
jgi:2-keto-4-pentenoate hydratase